MRPPPPPLPPDLLDLPYAALENHLAARGVKPCHARPIWRALYRDFAAPSALSSISYLPSLPSSPPSAFSSASTDGLTRKFLLRLADNQTIETVLMAYPGRFTACLSTQVGCAMGCVFCATGQSGFTRHLRPGEIVAQVLHCQRELRAAGQPGLRNLVLMGMGEPLHNYDNVLAALDIITDDRGLNLTASRVSISTVGVVPGILRLAGERQPYNLAVSLHGATEAERAALVPVSARWPLASLIAACRTYSEKTGRRVFFEWTLIAGVNDSEASARRLAALLAGMSAHVNLIPLNPTAGFAGETTRDAAVDAFQRVLRDHGLPCTVRQRRGIDVAAGCGQLRAEREPKRALAAPLPPTPF